MSSEFVIDSYAWIEYFAGSTKGARARNYIQEGDAATPTVVIAELSRKFIREVAAGRESPEGRLTRLSFVRASTTIADLTDEIATSAGEIDVDRKKKIRDWGLADSIVLSTARTLSAKVVTGDKHFRDLRDEIVFLN
jgi:predicted nucleic acid-binding protein